MKRRHAMSGNGFAVSRDLTARLISIDGLKPLGRVTRKHPPGQIRKLQASLEKYGFVLPIVIDQSGRVIAGAGLVLAAKNLKLTDIPAITLTDLDDAQLRLLRLALNRLGEDAEWDREALSFEFQDILQIDSEVDLRISGFEMGEIDLASVGAPPEDDEDDESGLNDVGITQAGDLWHLGPHRILCRGACHMRSYRSLLGDERAEMVFTKPPPSISIGDHVSGHGRARHQGLMTGSTEPSQAADTSFLAKTLGLAAAFSADGCLHFVSMDWRRMNAFVAEAAGIYSETLDFCVWVQADGGTGSLYRSQHLPILVFKNGTKPHINNVAAARLGRDRTNVWAHPDRGSMSASGTSKSISLPVALVADALLDCSDRGGIVLDPFGGTGVTLLAAEKTGRHARLIEIEPRCVDLTIRRWQRLTGGIAIHAETGRPFQPGPHRSPVGRVDVTMIAPRSRRTR